MARFRPFAIILGSVSALLSAITAGSAAEISSENKSQADVILKAVGVTGGVVVHLGCGDGSLTAALQTSNAFVVQGLEREPERVQGAREHIRALGLYGPVSVDLLSGKTLPYIDNTINLLIAEDLRDIPMTRSCGCSYRRAWRTSVRTAIG
ncbi:MAG: hypothetical protein AB7I48_27090, partial [Planctomycetaceae bacterium]